MLKSRLPSSDVWPEISIFTVGYSFMTCTAFFRMAKDEGRMSAELRLKVMPLMTPVNLATAAGTSSGQPSSSW